MTYTRIPAVLTATVLTAGQMAAPATAQVTAARARVAVSLTGPGRAAYGTTITLSGTAWR